MQIRFSLLFILVSLAACQALTESHNYDDQRLADKPSRQWTHHNESEISLRIVVPEGWETYNTSAGIVLNEYMGSNAPDQPLRGFLIHIFVQNLSGFHLPDWAGRNMAWMVLKQVVHNPDYVGNAIVSEPVGFDWDGHDAAYYLLNNRDGTVTMLLALDIADQDNMIVCHVSVPQDQSGRIRELLPGLLATLTIDGTRIDIAALETLPQPLEFP